MPRIDDMIDRLGQAKYFTVLDLTRGYWQVPLHPDSRSKTAFTTPFGLFQFKTMPFGLKGAPATFQRLMDRLLQDCQAFAAAYLDDLIIFSETFDDHLQHIRAVLDRLQELASLSSPVSAYLEVRRQPTSDMSSDVALSLMIL